MFIRKVYSRLFKREDPCCSWCFFVDFVSEIFFASPFCWTIEHVTTIQCTAIAQIDIDIDTFMQFLLGLCLGLCCCCSKVSKCCCRFAIYTVSRANRRKGRRERRTSIHRTSCPLLLDSSVCLCVCKCVHPSFPFFFLLAVSACHFDTFICSEHSAPVRGQ